MDGSLGRQVEKVRVFVKSLGRQTEIPILFRDERLSTVSAKRLMQNVRNKKVRHDDAIAAAFILQGYLDEKY